MLIGDFVTYKGRRYVVAGFTPMSVRPAQVELGDPRTGEKLAVDRELLDQPEQPERAAMRVVPIKGRRLRRH
jgi:hypothetical protein